MNSSATITRRLPVGAEPQVDGGTHFRVLAPRSRTVSVALVGSESLALTAEGNGYFSAHLPAVSAGSRYKLKLTSGSFPDPVSRFQPEGVHGPSEVIDPTRFSWTDHGWRGVTPAGQVIYEMHVGTFTPEGTWAAAARELPELARLGITVIELMPVAEFPGRFGWGYDGVDLFAPTRLYGTPDDFRAFVDQAHAHEIGVILDVVYNHLGPDGNYLTQFSESYFSKHHSSEWGDAPNFDDAESLGTREFVLANATYWIQEFHLDGLRLDATQQIFDDSPLHIIAAINDAVRAAGQGRSTYLVGENEPQHVKLVRPRAGGGYGLDAVWNDDLHHSALVALTGSSEAYYTDYRGTPQEFISGAKWGYLYQGQRYKWQKARRGTSSMGLPATSFVNFLQNHDQIANSLRGLRAHQLTSPGRYRALTTFLLLAPGTPMLFQGQEFAASTPFLYFADHHAELVPLVARGRAKFLSQFPSIAAAVQSMELAPPDAVETFERSKLRLSERGAHAEVYRLHQDLLRLRREEPLFRDAQRGNFDGAVLAAEAFVLRWFGDGGDDRLLLVNLGSSLHLDPAPEPLLAPVEGTQWELKWSSEDVAYGGGGTPAPDSEENWRVPAHAAVVMVPKRLTRDERSRPTD